MSSVQIAKPEMFESIIELLNDFKNPRITNEDWLRLLNPPWQSESEFPGFVLIDNNKINGFVGTIFCKKEIDGREEKFCNISSWIVREENRNESLSLLMPILKLKDYTLTNLTPSKPVSLIMKSLKFTFLDNSAEILFPSPYQFFANRKITVTADNEKIKSLLNEKDLTIFYDHLPCECCHLVAHDSKSYCYILITKTFKRGLPFNNIHYISNLDFFVKNIDNFRSGILKKTGILFTVIDSRLLKGRKIPFSRTKRYLSTQYFRSNTLKREKIDNLYSEYILLNL